MDRALFQTPKRSNYYKLAFFAAFLALAVIMLGAYTRLSDAGLGCPDWPGCYGRLVLPKNKPALTQAQKTFPSQPIVARKAWTEMVHRYFAGTLGLLIITLAVWALVKKRHAPMQPLFIPWLLVLLVGFQALLGMWTVTLKLLPLVVMGHLLGGMTIVSLLWWLSLSTRPTYQPSHYFKLRSIRPWAVLGLMIVSFQIFLGAWTSTNYSALACPTFPLCHGTLFPHMDWRSAFNFASPIGPNYDGGHLAMNARVTIQMAHRYGAFITTAFLIPFAITLITVREFTSLRRLGWLVLLLLATQVSLGILNIKLTLPMWTAVAHNGMAALLLITMVTITYKLFGHQKRIL